MLGAAAAAGWWQEPAVLAVPVVVIGSIALVQHPEWLFYLLMASVPWSVEYNFTPSLGTDLPDEPLMLLAAFTITALILFKRKQLTRDTLHPLLLLLLLQFLWTVATVITSTYPLLSLKYLLAKSWYLLAFVALPLYLFRDKRLLKNAAMMVLLSMMAFMMVAIVRHAQNGWTFEKINDSLSPFYRNHVNYSAVLVFMVPLQLAVMRLTSGRIRQVITILFIITLGALYFSYARGAWLALITGLISYWLLRKKWLLPAFILVMVLSIGAVFWLKAGDRYLKYSHDYKSTIFHTNFSEHLVATYEFKDVSTAERFYRWIAGVRMIRDNWKTGVGPTTFYNNYKSYAIPAFKTWVSNNEEHSTVHNYFLLMIIEQGVPGLLLFLVLLGALFWYIQRLYHRTDNRFWKTTIATTGAVMVMICTVNFLSDLVETDKVGSFFYVCVAVIITADMATRRSEASTDIHRVA